MYKPLVTPTLGKIFTEIPSKLLGKGLQKMPVHLTASGLFDYGNDYDTFCYLLPFPLITLSVVSHPLFNIL